MYSLAAEPELLDTTGQLVTVMEDESASFTCRATGLPRPVIFWLKNGQPLDDRHTSRITITSSLLPGDLSSTGLPGRSSVLTISDALFPSDTGNYNCKAVNGAGLPATLSSPFRLVVMRGEMVAIPLCVCFI